MKNIRLLAILVATLPLLISCNSFVTHICPSNDSSMSNETQSNTTRPTETDSSTNEPTSNETVSDESSEPINSGTITIDTTERYDPQLNDLFDIVQSRKEAENTVKELQLTSEWYAFSWQQWQLSFLDVVDMIGKPHGVRKDHPDTLVWITDTGISYGIRFEIDNDYPYLSDNSYEQLTHSHAVWYHPVKCDFVIPEETYLSDLPIKNAPYPEVDSSLWKELVFNHNNDNLPADTLLKELDNLSCLSFDDITSFVGKPYGFFYQGSSSGLIRALFWISDAGYYYYLPMSSYLSKNSNIVEELSTSVVAGTEMTPITDDILWLDEYTITIKKQQ